MVSLFFYGTLRHPPLLEAVLGRPADAIDAVPAELPDHAACWVKDRSFPTIVARPGARARGLLVRGLSDDDLARLNYYEGGFSYDLRSLDVEAEGGSVPAQVYFPHPGLWTPAEPWSLEDWVRDWGAMSVFAAQEVMGYFGSRTAEEVAAMFPMIRARADSRARAAKGSAARGPSGMDRRNLRLTGQRRRYANYFALDEYDLSFDRFDQTPSPVVERAVFVAADAVIVLPYDPVRDRVLLVEQMRAGPLGRGDPEVWQLEPVAGRIDPGEDPETTARREMLEEAGLEAQRLETVAQVYASPGCSTEYFFVFVALTDLADGGRSGLGVESEAEDIRTHVMPFEALMELVDRQAAANAPLVLAALWLARARDRLRGLA